MLSSLDDVRQQSSIPPSIPDHQLIQSIGRGSYGEVWLARNVLGTLRAVKIVRKAVFTNLRPFEREFAGIRKFEPISRTHDGLVDVLQVGRNEEEGFFYYVMELADPLPNGMSASYNPRSLSSDLVLRHRLPVSECIHLFHGLALALAHLHRAGLVHRDIKPSNIIYVDGTAKFADVGLVASADDSLSYVGTEGFIPPEGAGTVTADIYSLGKMLYETGTGRDRNDFPTLPPDVSDLANSAGLLELNAIWLKACATHPSERYQNANELAADLALLQAGRSVKRLRLVEGRLKQARQLVLGIAVLAVLAVLGGFLAQRQASTERENRKLEEMLRRRAQVAEQSAQERLSEAIISQARAILQSQQIGRRATVLALLTNRVPTTLRVQARSLAATALALPDLVPDPDAKSDQSSGTPSIIIKDDGSILVRDPRTGRSPRLVPPQGEPVRDPLILSDEGRFLYAGYGLYTERIWDLDSSAKIVELNTNYFTLAFRPHHPEAAVAYTNGDVVLHHLPDWTKIHTWTNATIESPLRWSPDGKSLIILSGSRELQMADAQTFAIKPVEKLIADLETANWHPDGLAFAMGTTDGYLHVRETQEWKESTILGRHQAQIINTLFLPPFPWLLTSSWDGTSRLWDWHAGQELGRIEATGYEISYNPIQQKLIWRLGSEPASRTWKLTGGEVWKEWFYGDPHESGGPFMTSFSGDGQWLAAPDTDGIRIWHVETGTLALFEPCYSQAVFLNKDATEMFSNSNNGIRRWRLISRPGHLIEVREAQKYEASQNEGKLTVSADSTILAWIAGGEVHLIDHGKNRSWNHGQEMAETIVISPDGRWLAVGTRNHLGARVFEVADGRLAWQTSVGHGTHLAVSSDSQWLAIGTENGCYVFRMSDGQIRWHHEVTPGEDPSFWEVAFSPDGSTLAWTPKPSRVQLLDASNGQEIMTLEYPTRRYITRLLFSPDGTWLVEASSKHVLHLWDLQGTSRN